MTRRLRRGRRKKKGVRVIAPLKYTAACASLQALKLPDNLLLLSWRYRLCLLARRRQWRGAKGAARSLKRDTAQTIGAVTSSRRSLHFLWLVMGQQCIHWQHDEIVDNRSNDHKGNDRVDDSADHKWFPGVGNSNCPG